MRQSDVPLLEDLAGEMLLIYDVFGPARQMTFEADKELISAVVLLFEALRGGEE